MVQAVWNGTVIAEAKDNEIVIIEGNTYFPPSAIKKDLFKPNPKTTTCPWKGVASYFDVVVNGKTNAGAAWVYQSPKEKAQNIKGYYAFWNGIQIQG